MSRWGKRLPSWKTTLTGRSPGGRVVTSLSATRTRPAVSGMNPAAAPSRVDFPEPDGPTTAVIAPGATEKFARSMKSPWRISTQSNRNMAAPSPVEGTEQGKRHHEEQQRGRSRIVHPVGPHQAVDLKRQRRGLGVGEKRDHAEVAHRKRSEEH